jgi:hypothetical protein
MVAVPAVLLEEAALLRRAGARRARQTPAADLADGAAVPVPAGAASQSLDNDHRAPVTLAPTGRPADAPAPAQGRTIPAPPPAADAPAENLSESRRTDSTATDAALEEEQQAARRLVLDDQDTELKRQRHHQRLPRL